MDFVIDERFDILINDAETIAHVMDKRLNVQRKYLDDRIGFIYYDGATSTYVAEFAPFHTRRGIKDFDNLLDAVDYIVQCAYKSEGKLV